MNRWGRKLGSVLIAIMLISTLFVLLFGYDTKIAYAEETEKY